LLFLSLQFVPHDGDTIHPVPFWLLHVTPLFFSPHLHLKYQYEQGVRSTSNNLSYSNVILNLMNQALMTVMEELLFCQDWRK
jgi:hypothetical protein